MPRDKQLHKQTRGICAKFPQLMPRKVDPIVCLLRNRLKTLQRYIVRRIDIGE